MTRRCFWVALPESSAQESLAGGLEIARRRGLKINASRLEMTGNGFVVGERVDPADPIVGEAWLIGSVGPPEETLRLVHWFAAHGFCGSGLRETRP